MLVTMLSISTMGSLLLLGVILEKSKTHKIVRTTTTVEVLEEFNKPTNELNKLLDTLNDYNSAE